LRKRSIKRSWTKQATDHQHGLYYEPFRRSRSEEVVWGVSDNGGSNFEAAGRGHKPYWGKWGEAAPTIILWESLTEEDKKVCLKEMRTSKNWVVWCRSKKKGNEELERLLSEDGREVFQGKCGGGEAKGEDESEEKETRKGRTRRSKGWWRRGDVGAYQNAGRVGPGHTGSYQQWTRRPRKTWRQRGRQKMTRTSAL
jgi:hypothetical protein